VQYLQDSGYNWASAVKQADASVRIRFDDNSSLADLLAMPVVSHE
jgi:hypothetical protein